MEEELLGKNYLVTTPIQDTWPTSGKIIFLGEWCKIYSKSIDWNNLDHKVLPYHWDDRNKLSNDFDYLNKLYESVLVSLSLTLNKTHKVEFSTKYWRILIGPWLGTFIQVLFDRWEMIQVALNSKEQMYSITINRDQQKFVPNDMKEFYNLIITDEWNQYIYETILIYTKNIHLIKIKTTTDIDIDINIEKESLLKKLYTSIIKYLTPSSSPFFLNSYFSKIDELKLGMKNKFIPYFFNLKKLKKYDVDIKKRMFTIEHKRENKFDFFLLNIIVSQIPKVYLEGFRSLAHEVNSLKWQKNPKFIFSSNSFWLDDLFKYYTIKNKFNNIPLYTGQHGGNFGVAKLNWQELHQLAISDKFISWGWSNKKNKKKISPIGKISHKKSLKVNHYENKKLLLVTCCMPRYSRDIFSSIISSQWLNYCNDQFRFINALNQEIKDKTTVRLYPHDYKWNQQLRWKDKFNTLDYDFGKKTIINQLKQTKIFVSTYNATTFLESIQMNIPTIMFWDSNYWELRDEAIPFFKELEKAKIFHNNPESAAKQINIIWNNPKKWWESKQVRDAISNFKLEFCKESENLINEVHASLNLNHK